MTADTGEREAGHPVLLCFDGSDDPATAIAQAGELLAPRRAVVLTVWEPVATWEPYDPATILSAPVSKLLPKSSASTRSPPSWHRRRPGRERSLRW